LNTLSTSISAPACEVGVDGCGVRGFLFFSINYCCLSFEFTIVGSSGFHFGW
jgi:hypothetical protein